MRAASCAAGTEVFHVEQLDPVHAPWQPVQVRHLASGTPPCWHLSWQTLVSQCGPSHPASHEHEIFRAVCRQSPWPEQPAVRFVQNAVSQWGPDQPSAHSHWLLTHAQSKHSRALQSMGPSQPFAEKATPRLEISVSMRLLPESAEPEAPGGGAAD